MASNPFKPAPKSSNPFKPAPQGGSSSATSGFSSAGTGGPSSSSSDSSNRTVRRSGGGGSSASPTSNLLNPTPTATADQVSVGGLVSAPVIKTQSQSKASNLNAPSISSGNKAAPSGGSITALNRDLGGTADYTPAGSNPLKETIKNAFSKSSYSPTFEQKLAEERLYGQPLSAYDRIIMPFKEKGKRKGEQSVVDIKYGSNQGSIDAFAPKTRREKFRSENAVENLKVRSDFYNFNQALQKDINKGDLDVTSAEKRSSAFFEKNVLPFEEKNFRASSEFARVPSYEFAKNTLPSIAKTGTLIGTSLINPALGATTALTFGSKDIVGGATKVSDARNFKDFGAGSLQFGLGVGQVFGGGKLAQTAVYNVDKQVVRGQLEALAGSPLKVVNFQKIKGDKGAFAFTAKQNFGSLSKTITGKGILKTTDNSKTILAGTYKEKISGEVYNIFAPNSKTMILQTRQGKTGSLGVSKELGNDFTLSLNKVGFKPTLSSSVLYGIDAPKKTVGRFATSVTLGGKVEKTVSPSLSKLIYTSPDNTRTYKFSSFSKAGQKSPSLKSTGLTFVKEVEDTSFSSGSKGLGMNFGKSSPTRLSPVNLDTSIKQFTKTSSLTDPFAGAKSTPAIERISRQTKVLKTFAPPRSSSLVGFTPQETSTLTKSSAISIGSFKSSSPSFKPLSSKSSSQSFTSSFASAATQIPAVQQTTAQSFKPFNFSGTASFNSPNLPNEFNTPRFGGGFPSFDLDETRGTRKKIKGKQRKKYTPSYEALVFNIRGKKPKSLLSIRPITKGYKWDF